MLDQSAGSEGSVPPGALVSKTNKCAGERRYCPRGYWVPALEFPVGYGRRTCPVCGPKRAAETARMLYLDAQVEPPTHALVLTTRDPDTTAEQVRRGAGNVFRALRRETGVEVEYFGRVEFTTGQAQHSGGHRRIHLHYVVKGLAGRRLQGLREAVTAAWTAQNPGAWRLQLEELRTAAGAIHYLGLHHAKPEQHPPAWWSGRSERVSRGYWSEPAGGLRERARRELWAERYAHSTGLSLDDARFAIDQTTANRERVAQLVAEARELRAWVPVALADQTSDQRPSSLFDEGIPF